MGSQFSEEFLLGYRTGHRDGFADALLLLRDALTPHARAHALARRRQQLATLPAGIAPEPPGGHLAKSQLIAAGGMRLQERVCELQEQVES